MKITLMTRAAVHSTHLVSAGSIAKFNFTSCQIIRNFLETDYMGFLLGFTHKVVGPILICEGDLKNDIWTYLSNGELTHDGNFLNTTISLPKTLIAIEELDSQEHRQRISADIRARFRRLAGANLLVVGAAMVSPIAGVVTAAINESNKDEIAANLPPVDIFTCFRGTLKDRRTFVAVTLRPTFEKIKELLVRA